MATRLVTKKLNLGRVVTGAPAAPPEPAAPPGPPRPAPPANPPLPPAPPLPPVPGPEPPEEEEPPPTPAPPEPALTPPVPPPVPMGAPPVPRVAAPPVPPKVIPPVPEPGPGAPPEACVAPPVPAPPPVADEQPPIHPEPIRQDNSIDLETTAWIFNCAPLAGWAVANSIQQFRYGAIAGLAEAACVGKLPTRNPDRRDFSGLLTKIGRGTDELSSINAPGWSKYSSDLFPRLTPGCCWLG